MTIRGYYTSVLTKFAECARESKLDIGEVSTSIKAIKRGRQVVGYNFVLDTPLRLRADLSPESSQTKTIGEDGQLELLIWPRERYNKPTDLQIQESVIEVAYVLHPYVGNPRLLFGCHYDFQCEENGDPRDGHPLFHAQLTNDLFNLNKMLEGMGVQANSKPVFPQVRLPTAHMSFTGTLISIAADNFSTVAFSKFLKNIREHVDYPHMTNQNFHDRMEDHEWRMRSCVWYPD